MNEAQILELLANGGGGIGTALTLWLLIRSALRGLEDRLVQRMDQSDGRVDRLESRIGKLEGAPTRIVFGDSGKVPT